MNYEKKIKEEYFTWLYDRVCKEVSHDTITFVKLFECLHSTTFNWLIPNDVNRAKDGETLRYRYAMECDDISIRDILAGPCSVLEMMVALAIRIEESMMDDPRYGDRTGQWFWTMLANIGISHMADGVFDEEYVRERIIMFLDRCYEPNGKGGLFYIKNCDEDLRYHEIWTQLCWYVSDFY